MDRLAGSSAANCVLAPRLPLRLVSSNLVSCDDAAGEPGRAPGGRRASIEAVPVKAGDISLDRHASLDDAIAEMLSSCLDHFAANEPALRETGDPEAVHQLRVALRRLRAALGLLKSAVPCVEFDTAAARARTIAAGLGEARDWDVFAESLDAGPRERLNDEPSFYALLDAVELRRAQAHRNARALIVEQTTQQFAADLRLALRRKAWRDGARDDATRTGDPGSAREFAARALDRLHRRAVKKCQGLAALTPEQRHRARIALKKARYAAEFFETLFDAPARARRYLRSLGKIQESLGADNDAAAAARLLREIEADGGGQTAFASGFVRGWRAHEQALSAAGAKRSEKLVKKLEPFWR